MLLKTLGGYSNMRDVYIWELVCCTNPRKHHLRDGPLCTKFASVQALLHDLAEQLHESERVSA